MTNEGFRSISIEDAYFEPLADRAEKNHRSVAAELRVILDEAGVGPKKKVSAR